MTDLALIIATIGKTGYMKYAPGTAGSAVGLGMYLAMHYMGIGSTVQVIVTVAVIAGGIWAAGEAARHFQQDDPSQVVIDEVAGQLVTLVLTGAKLQGAIVGFFIFRALDVIKPWPAGPFERMHGGAGIVLDDVVVAIYGNAILQAAFWGLPLLGLPDLR
jgi:phosphatidylglycerophosphatase A